MRSLKNFTIPLFIVFLLLITAACQQDDSGSSSTNGSETAENSGTENSPRDVEDTPLPTATPLPTPYPLSDFSIGGHLAPVTTRTVHIVQPGDTLSGIANKYGLTTKIVADANRIYNYDLIEVGDTIYIPPCEVFVKNN